MFPITTETDLIYNLVEERLSGSIDGTVIQAHAVSGGRAGSKQVGVLNPFLANNPYATHVKKNITKSRWATDYGKVQSQKS